MTHDELVEKMLDAYMDRQPDLSPYSRTSAVLRVCVEELLGDPSDEEHKKFAHCWTLSEMRAFTRNRWARYSPHTPCLEDRIREILVRYGCNPLGEAVHEIAELKKQAK